MLLWIQVCADLTLIISVLGLRETEYSVAWLLSKHTDMDLIPRTLESVKVEHGGPGSSPSSGEAETWGL